MIIKGTFDKIIIKYDKYYMKYGNFFLNMNHIKHKTMN